jgi:hypothetical protein
MPVEPNRKSKIKSQKQQEMLTFDEVLTPVKAEEHTSAQQVK